MEEILFYKRLEQIFLRQSCGKQVSRRDVYEAPIVTNSTNRNNNSE